MKRFKISLLLALAALPTLIHAQLSTNKDKFLGNITTGWTNMDYAGYKFSDYWNQVTPENATKWECVEGTRGQYNWWNADVAANYARQHGFPFKFHTLVWGSQFPAWLKNLSVEQRYEAIVKWMDQVKKHFPDLQLIDVVNEAVEGHQADTHYIKEALGGGGETGYDWIIKAFEMAAERWPDAILIYNDYNTFQWNVDQFIDLVKTIRNAGAPVDAYGCQSHELGGWTGLASVMQRIQNELKMPMYITEYDISDGNDGNQNWNYQQHIPLMWEADYCAGVTLWGWHHGMTWVDDSGLIRNGKERPALQWLRDYMKTDKAKQAKSPFPGMKKEASVYVKPESLRGELNTPMSIEVLARMKTKTIDHIDFYVNGQLYQTLTSAPYTVSYTPTDAGRYDLKAVTVTTDGTQYERLSAFTVKALLAVSKRFTSLAEIGSTPFAIVNEQEGKAIYGSDNQNLRYADYATAFDEVNTGYLFKLERSTVTGCYLLRLITPAGREYSIWGSPGYLNGYSTQLDCSFILGLNNQNGQDVKNGAVWEINYVADKGFTLKNMYTGKYLHDATSAKYDEPTYFTFCTLGATSGIADVKRDRPTDARYYTLDGRPLSGKPSRPGIYIHNGRKIVLK